MDPRAWLHQKRENLYQRYVVGWKSQALFELFTFTDFITIVAISMQVLLLVSRLETLEEARIILVFHVVGTVMEIFKTHVGSWNYPEPSYLRIADVPLFSGFMYASVGSFIARVWRIFDFQFDRFPRLRWQCILAMLIYINFFSHHYIIDIRNGLFVAAAILYGRTMIHFRADKEHRSMPLLLGLGLVALFIWFAENIATYANAWNYPSQEDGWHLVSMHTMGAWFLLMLISFVLVASVHVTGDRAKVGKKRDAEPDTA